MALPFFEKRKACPVPIVLVCWEEKLKKSSLKFKSNGGIVSPDACNRQNIDSLQFTLCFHERVTCHRISSRVFALPFGGQGTPGLTPVTLHLYPSPVGVNAPTAGRVGGLTQSTLPLLIHHILQGHQFTLLLY